MQLFEHLIDPAFEAPEDVSSSELVSAQVNTLDWLDAPLEPASQTSKTLARNAFASVTSPDADVAITTATVLQLRTPAAVQHLVSMLAKYDWDFIEQAKEIRGYVVSQLLEETKSSDARIRLRALELTGKLTEVASFTERSEVVHKHEESGEIEDRLRARLKMLLPPQQPAEDLEVKEIAVVKHESAIPG